MTRLAVILWWLVLPTLAHAATLTARINGVIASAQAGNKPVTIALKLTNKGVNAILERTPNQGRADFESSGDIPKMQHVLNQHKDDEGVVPSGKYGYAALKCGILQNVDSVDQSKLGWTEVMEPGDKNPRVVVLYEDTDGTTWVLDSLEDDLYDLKTRALNYSEANIYSCDAYSAISVGRR